MRRFAWACALLLPLLLLLPVGAQPPAEVKVPVGRLAAIQFETLGKPFTYEVLGDLDCFREFTDGASVRLRLIGYKPGSYYLIVAVGGDKGAPPVLWKSLILVGDAPPPGPNPPGPEPTTPLYQGLKAAWATEVATDRVAKRDALAAVYREAISYCVPPTKDRMQGELIARVSSAAKSLVGDPLKVLPAVRREISAYFKANLPTDPAVLLDAMLCARNAAHFTAVANALEALRP